MYILNYNNLNNNLEICINKILSNINYNEILIYSVININDIIISILNNINEKEVIIITKEDEEYINFKKVDINNNFFSVDVIFNTKIEKNIKIISTSNPNFINKCAISIIDSSVYDCNNEFIFENYEFLFHSVNSVLFYNPIPYNKFKQQIFLKNWLYSIEDNDDINEVIYCNKCNLPLLSNKCYFCCKEYEESNCELVSIQQTDMSFLNVLLTDESTNYLPVQKNSV